MGKIKRAFIAAIMAFLAGIGIIACASSPAEPNGRSEIAQKAADEAKKPKGALAFGETAETESHIKVKLSDFQRGTSSDTAVPSDTDQVKYRVWVTNDSDKPLNLGWLTAGCMYGNPAQPAEEVFDSARGLNGTPSSSLLPGDTARFALACALPESEKYLRIQIGPNWDDTPAMFAGSVN
jgi:hypothetical protein